jgi:hypothetical protein
MFVTLLLVAVAACAFSVIASIIFNWASDHSAAWNLGFGAVLVLAGGAALLLPWRLFITVVAGDISGLLSTSASCQVRPHGK